MRAGARSPGRVERVAEGSSDTSSTTSTWGRPSSTISPTASTRSLPYVGRGSALRATEPAETVDYAPPPLVVAHLSVALDGPHRGRLPPTEGRIRSIRLGDATLEGPEEDLLRAFVAELDRADPDVLLTEGGDAFDLPWLYRRAAACGLGPEAFALGREPVAFRPARAARSFETYGRILYRSATYPLPGTVHLDRENSFLFDDADLAGLVDAARLSRLSLSTVARQSPGTCFTAMEMAQALPARRPRAVEEEPARVVPAGRPLGRRGPGRGDLPAARRRLRTGRRVRFREPVPAHHGAEEPLRRDARVPVLPREPDPGPGTRLSLLHAPASGSSPAP